MNPTQSAMVAVAAMLGVIVPAEVACATDRFYLDSFAISPDGRYRVDAKSPDNAPGVSRPFARSFTYTLTDQSTKTVVWTRRQPMSREKASSYTSWKEPSPTSLFVRNDGLVVAGLADDSILVLEPDDGQKRGSAQILSAFPAVQQDLFVSQTTAGPMWAQGSSWYFVDAVPAKGKAARAYFVVRPYWGHRIVVDLEAVEHVDLGAFHSAASAAGLAETDELRRGIIAACIAEETRSALAALEQEATSTSVDEDYARHHEVSAALTSVILLRIAEAGPLLEKIEVKDRSGRRYPWSLEPDLRAALRAIGRTPRPYVGSDFLGAMLGSSSTGSSGEEAERVPVPTDVRVENASLIKAGMPSQRMVDLIGLPDARMYTADGFAVDYDIDGAAPRTLRVTLSQDLLTVTSVREITPFAFLHDPGRMNGW